MKLWHRCLVICAFLLPIRRLFQFGRNLMSYSLVIISEKGLKGGQSMGTVALETEAVLVEQAKTDEQAFRRLYEQHLPGLYRYAYYRTGNKQLAEDVVSQTFMRVWQNLKRYQQRGIPFSHWLYRIAGNIISDLRPNREQAVGLSWDPPDELADTPTEQVDMKLDLALLMRTLPDAQQQVLALRYVQDLSLQDVAQVMGKSEGAIKQLAFRGLQTLRERMGGYAE